MGASKRAAATAATRKAQVPAGDNDPLNEKSGFDKPRRICLLKQLRKTKLCIYHLQGMCQYGEDCAFAHAGGEVQHAPDLRKTRLCKAYAAGKCNREDCGFAHGAEELRSTDMFYKKTLCMWHEKGKCRNGDQCRFAHGGKELRSTGGDLDTPKPSDYLDSSNGVKLEAPRTGKSLSTRAAAPAQVVRMQGPKGVLASSGKLSVGAVHPSSVEPMFVQPFPLAHVPAAAPVGQTGLAQGTGLPAPGELPLPLGMSALGARLAAPGLDMPQAAWPPSMGLAATSMGDVLAQEITRALEASQSQLSTISLLNPELINHPEAKADLQQLQENIQALSEQLSHFEVQLQKHNGLDGGPEEKSPYLQKLHSFSGTATDYSLPDYGLHPYDLPSVTSQSVPWLGASEAWGRDPLTCMGA